MIRTNVKNAFHKFIKDNHLDVRGGHILRHSHNLSAYRGRLTPAQAHEWDKIVNKVLKEHLDSILKKKRLHKEFYTQLVLQNYHGISITEDNVMPYFSRIAVPTWVSSAFNWNWAGQYMKWSELHDEWEILMEEEGI
jgi:hypothetical protein